MSVGVCRFTRLGVEENESEFNGIFRAKRTDKSECGSYVIDTSCDEILEKYVLDAEPTQPLANCAAENLRINSEMKRLPFWTQRSSANKMRNLITDKGLENEVQVVAIEDFLNEPVDHSVKSKRLLEEFGKSLGATLAFGYFNPSWQDRIKARIATEDECEQLIDELVYQEYLREIGRSMGGSVFQRTLQFTTRGWARLSATSQPSSNKVFIAMDFNWDDSREQKQVVEGIKAACTRHGFDADIVSRDHTEFITNRIISEIRACSFVVAEFTRNNRGVYFESGFARALGKQVFHLVKEGYAEHDVKYDSVGKKIHFDIAQVNYRKWSTVEELESLLADWVGAVMGPYIKNA